MNKHQKISLQIQLKKETSTVATIGNQSLEEKAKATEEGEKSNREIRCSQIYLTLVQYLLSKLHIVIKKDVICDIIIKVVV